MKKNLLLLILFGIICTEFQAQMRVKTEDGKTIELSSDGTWKVVESNNKSNTIRTTTRSEDNTTNSGQNETQTEPVKQQTKECEDHQTGEIVITNNLPNQISLNINGVVRVVPNPYFGIMGQPNSEYMYVLDVPRNISVRLNPKQTYKITKVRIGYYNYDGYEDLRLSDRANRNAVTINSGTEVSPCQISQILINF